jgi:hypothetical protein
MILNDTMYKKCDFLNLCDKVESNGHSGNMISLFNNKVIDISFAHHYIDLPFP